MFIFYHEFDSMSSGTAVVILNLIKGLVQKKQKVLFFAHLNGVLHGNLKDLDTNFLMVINNDKYSIHSNKHLVSSRDIIITTHYYSIFGIFKKNNPKIIFYCVNINSLSRANFYFNKLKLNNLTKKLVKHSVDGNGLLFIDKYAWEENERILETSIANPAFLPIPVEVPRCNLWKQKENPCNELSFSYVGRAANWKIYPIRKVLKDISVLFPDNNQKISFHIVTDNAEVFMKQIADIDERSVRIFFRENLSQKELSDFLLENSCLHFAMGTSALDGAKLGIPTVLLDFSFDEFPDNYLYNFLYSTEGNSVGTWIKNKTVLQGYTIRELLGFVKNKERIAELSDLSYSYVKNNHQLSVVTDTLIHFSEQCQMDLKKTSKFLIRYWL
jgi:hypothetical protein